MCEKSKQVEGDRNHGEKFVTMTVVVVKMIALSFERIVGLIFIFPSCSTSIDNGLEGVAGDEVGCDKR